MSNTNIRWTSGVGAEPTRSGFVFGVSKKVNYSRRREHDSTDTRGGKWGVP